MVLLRLVWRGFGDRGYWRGWTQRLGLTPVRAGARNTIWVHAVSVGEVRAAVPLVKALRERFVDSPIVVTTMTPTGADCVRQVLDGTATHSFVPYDLPIFIRAFLHRARPTIAVFMETELWPNILHMCHQQGVPVVIANARLSQRSLLGYRRIGALTRDMLQKVAMVAAQSRPDAGRFSELGINPARLSVAGNVKFDLTVSPDIKLHGRELRAKLGGSRPVWIAASTHEGEEAEVLHAHQRILRHHADALLLIAPRHPPRFARVRQLIADMGLSVANRTQTDELDPAVQVMVVDTMGELLAFYAAVDVAFVGGSLVPTGGHNMLEPAAVGVPVLTGPQIFNFVEISARLHAAGAAFTVHDETELAGRLCQWFSDPVVRREVGLAGIEVVQSNRGAVDRIVRLTEDCLHSRS